MGSKYIDLSQSEMENSQCHWDCLWKDGGVNIFLSLSTINALHS